MVLTAPCYWQGPLPPAGLRIGSTDLSLGSSITRRTGAAVALSLHTFDPTILKHGYLATVDVGLSAFTLVFRQSTFHLGGYSFIPRPGARECRLQSRPPGLPRRPGGSPLHKLRGVPAEGTAGGHHSRHRRTVRVARQRLRRRVKKSCCCRPLSCLRRLPSSPTTWACVTSFRRCPSNTDRRRGRSRAEMARNLGARRDRRTWFVDARSRHRHLPIGLDCGTRCGRFGWTTAK